MSLKSTVLMSVFLFGLLSIMLLIQHEIQVGHLTSGSVKQLLMKQAASDILTNPNNPPKDSLDSILENIDQADQVSAFNEKKKSSKKKPSKEEVEQKEEEGEGSESGDDKVGDDDDDDSIFSVIDEDDPTKDTTKQTVGLDVEEYVDDDAKVGEDPVDSIADKLNQRADANDKEVDPVMATEGKVKGNVDAKVGEDPVDSIADKLNQRADAKDKEEDPVMATEEKVKGNVDAKVEEDLVDAIAEKFNEKGGIDDVDNQAPDEKIGKTSHLRKVDPKLTPGDISDNLKDTLVTLSMKNHSQSNNPFQLFSNEDFNASETKGKLFCNGKETDSEVIYWKIVPGDNKYESPITPHHKDHHDRYMTFEYDNGGWNNVRMSLECIIVIAHAMGRTLVIPPQQHLYLLGKQHKDEEDKVAHDEMGFEDFFDIDLLKSHQGFHTLTMKEFMEQEGCQGGLGNAKSGTKGMLPKNNNSEIWGQDLWFYLNKVADYTPEWAGRFMAFPDRPGDFNLTKVHHPKFNERIKAFGGERSPVYYDENMQSLHHIHIPGDSNHRVLQHHYAFAFFASTYMQSFYKRFVRDYMRYKDDIHCYGSEVIQAVRADALKETGASDYYALHIRRGDFQFKDVKIGAEEILKNLNFPDKYGNPIIPKGALVYLSTDDPKGICQNCLVNRIPCTQYEAGKKPPGCPEDPSWNAFIKAGWKIRFLHDYQAKGLLKDVNPNLFGMVESIVCSRAKVFAGTYFSTFTGYIHRLRGFHGLGESTFYHSTNYVKSLQIQKSVGHGFSREWRAGWTDDRGDII